jgi:hypothetical protein
MLSEGLPLLSRNISAGHYLESCNPFYSRNNLLSKDTFIYHIPHTYLCSQWPPAVIFSDKNSVGFLCFSMLRARIYNPVKPPALTISNSAFCVHVFRMILAVNSYYILKQRQPVDLCNGEELRFLCGTD